MKERFDRILVDKNLSATRFAGMIGVHASAVSHILSGRSKPGFDVLAKIAQAFPDVSLDWLVTGNGGMYNNSATLKSKPQPIQEAIPESRPDEPIRERTNKTIDSSENKLGMEAELAMMIPSVNRKVVKRIILFFEDGSFEDYAK